MFDVITLFAFIDRIANDACIFVAERTWDELATVRVTQRYCPLLATPLPRDEFDNIQVLIYSVKVHYTLGYNSWAAHYACANPLAREQYLVTRRENFQQFLSSNRIDFYGISKHEKDKRFTKLQPSHSNYNLKSKNTRYDQVQFSSNETKFKLESSKKM